MPRYDPLHLTATTLIVVQLRDIEILVQQELELPDRGEAKDSGVLKEIQKILYSTEVRLVP